jgi:hypothetical protein
MIDYGNGVIEKNKINNKSYNKIKEKFGGSIRSEYMRKSNFHFGDENIYITVCDTGYIQPCTKLVKFENRVKASPSTFSFSVVPEDAPVFDYPQNDNFWQSDRLLGLASEEIDLYKWDVLNTILGPREKVNLIMIGFNSDDESLGKMQENKWLGGKKNDLVLCYGMNPTPEKGKSLASWAYVFGWTDRQKVKRNLENVLLTNFIDDSILSLIKEEVEENYVIKEWDDFDYIKIKPPLWSYFLFIICMIIIQSIFYFFAKNN